MFEQGITLGIRRQIIQRSKLKRDFVTLTRNLEKSESSGDWLGDKVVFAKPEFSDCEKAAQEHKTPVKIIAEAAISAFWQTV